MICSSPGASFFVFAKVFSSADRSSVDLHFKWMQQYGVDGVFVQRFFDYARGGRRSSVPNTILAYACDAASKYNRAIAVMYDLSGLRAEGEDCLLLINDWKMLVDSLKITNRAMLSRAPFDMEEYKAFLDIDDVRGEEGYTTMERTGIRPCLDVCGIWGGYTGTGAKTVLPSTAHAKISMRLVPNQRSGEISKLFEAHFKSIAPKGVKVEVTPFEGGDGFLIPITSPAYKAASRAMEEVYGIEPVPSRGGGSIAILADMQTILGTDPLLMGFGLERDTIHSPNESYLLRQLWAGMRSISLFYKYF